MKDVTRNVLSLDTAALQALGFLTTLVVARPSLEVDGTITNAADGGTVQDSVFGARAQLIVPPDVLSTLTAVAIDVFSAPLEIPIPTGFKGPGSHFVNIDLTPEPSFPLPAPGLILVLPLPQARPPGTRLELFRVEPVTGELEPSAPPVFGTVNPEGLSATFTGITHLSIVV